MRVLHALLVAAALSAFGAPPAARSQSPQPATIQTDGEALVISVLTFGQGDPLWEKFGHNALRIRDARTGSDVAYNWGTFDFEQPNFVGRFLTGNTLYWLDSVSAPLMIEYYSARLNRTGVEQVLALTPPEAARLRDYVEWNVRPENRNYRYDYFVDNCSTRLRDVIDRGLAGHLRRSLAAMPSPHTFRSESLRLVDAMPLVQAGMHVALGEPADERLTGWEESFVPMRLMERMRAVRRADGRPLVASETVLYTATRAAEAERAGTLAGRFLVTGLLLAGIIALLAWRGARAGLAVMGVLWGVLAGVMGIVLATAWAATRHIFWYRNENLLQLLPLALLLVVVVPMALRRAWWRRAGLALAVVLAGASMLGLVLKPLPMFEQRNLAVILFALPVHVALAWALWRLRARDETRVAAR